MVDIVTAKRGSLPWRRVHVQSGARWATDAGSDFWLHPSVLPDQGAAATADDILTLAEAGWTATSLVATAGAAADFMSSTDRANPPHFLTNASGDLLDSPAIFGSYTHGWMAARTCGQSDLPRFLVAEFWGAMTVHSADEVRSGWGFVEDGGAPGTSADGMAWISSDGTNWQFETNAGTPVNGDADDANWHLFKIVLDQAAGNSYWYLDPALNHHGYGGGNQGGTSGRLTITADEFPVSFGFAALTTNRPALAVTHVYYDW